MKKILYSLFVMVAAAITFSSCEDVPMPYDDPNKQPIGPVLEEGVLLKETFASNFGGFAVFTKEGYGWIISHSTATGTGYQSGINKNSDSYLISPEIDLEGVDAAHISFEYLMAYAQNSGEDQLLITDSYNEAEPESTEWDVLENTSSWKGSSDWDTFTSFLKNLPQKYMGKKVRIAFRFTGLEKSKTWEIRNVVVKVGEGEEINGEPAEPKPEGAYFYETFSTDFGSFTTYKAIADGYDWFVSYNCAQGTGYQNKTNKTSAAYLISPEIDLSNSASCYLQFEYQLNTYGNPGNNKVLITDNYTGDPATTHWYNITGTLNEVSAWNWDNATTYKYNLPVNEKFTDRSKVRIAFYFDAGDKSQTWELRNAMLMEGDAGATCSWLDEFVNRGTYDAPISIADALALNDNDFVWVEGYIVGNFNTENNFVYAGANTTVKTNIAVSDNASDTNGAGAVPVQLARNMQAKFNVIDNPSLVGRRVVMWAKVTEFLGKVGLRDIKYIETEGDNGTISFGSKE